MTASGKFAFFFATMLTNLMKIFTCLFFRVRNLAESEVLDAQCAEES